MSGVTSLHPEQFSSENIYIFWRTRLDVAKIVRRREITTTHKKKKTYSH